jgi:hypothetical protein
MCQLRHPNIISAEDIYLPSDIPVEQRDSAMRLQRSNADHICVRMPYYPADMAWLIHSSPQVLTCEHVQVTLQPFHTQLCLRSACSVWADAPFTVHLRSDSARSSVLYTSLEFC